MEFITFSNVQLPKISKIAETRKWIQKITKNFWKGWWKSQKYEHFIIIVKNKVLSFNHERRVDIFIGESVTNPPEVIEYVHPKYDPRGFSSSNKSLKAWRMNYHTTKERLSDLSKTNSFLDVIPFHNTSLHQFRDFSSQSGEKALKLKPNSTTSRLVDFLTSSRTN